MENINTTFGAADRRPVFFATGSASGAALTT